LIRIRPYIVGSVDVIRHFKTILDTTTEVLRFDLLEKSKVQKELRRPHESTHARISNGPGNKRS
jgi:hypothetical protein